MSGVETGNGGADAMRDREPAAQRESPSETGRGGDRAGDIADLEAARGADAAYVGDRLPVVEGGLREEQERERQATGAAGVDNTNVGDAPDALVDNADKVAAGAPDASETLPGAGATAGASNYGGRAGDGAPVPTAGGRDADGSAEDLTSEQRLQLAQARLARAKAREAKANARMAELEAQREQPVEPGSQTGGGEDVDRPDDRSGAEPAGGDRIVPEDEDRAEDHADGGAGDDAEAEARAEIERLRNLSEEEQMEEVRRRVEERQASGDPIKLRELWKALITKPNGEKRGLPGIIMQILLFLPRLLFNIGKFLWKYPSFRWTAKTLLWTVVITSALPVAGGAVHTLFMGGGGGRR